MYTAAAAVSRIQFVCTGRTGDSASMCVVYGGVCALCEFNSKSGVA